MSRVFLVEVRHSVTVPVTVQAVDEDEARLFVAEGKGSAGEPLQEATEYKKIRQLESE